tara:strand:+ start:33 stop:182 length:150 start_codon:yes stop_codon:yes gene_type:complete
MQGCGTKKREKEEEEKKKALPRGGKFLDAPLYLLLFKVVCCVTYTMHIE